MRASAPSPTDIYKLSPKRVPCSFTIWTSHFNTDKLEPKSSVNVESNSILGFCGSYRTHVSHSSSMHFQHASPELTVTLHRHGHSRDEVSHLLHARPHSVSHVLDFWTTESLLPPIGQPTKRTPAIRAFIERGTLEAAHLGNEALAREISDEYATSLGRTTVVCIQNELKFHHREPRHTQTLSSRVQGVAPRPYF
jgi:hypothetical protein